MFSSLCICAFVCMLMHVKHEVCVCMHVCIHTYIHTHTYIYLRASAHTRAHTHNINIRTYAQILEQAFGRGRELKTKSVPLYTVILFINPTLSLVLLMIQCDLKMRRIRQSILLRCRVPDAHEQIFHGFMYVFMHVLMPDHIMQCDTTMHVKKNPKFMQNDKCGTDI